MIEKLRSSFDNLSERERKLVLALGVVFALIVFVLPGVLAWQHVQTMEAENGEMADILRDIASQRSNLVLREAQREQTEARYQNPPPALSSFLEERAGAEQLTLREVTDQPEKQVEGFRRREVRATLPSVDLRAAVRMMTAIENSDFPVAVHRIQIETLQGEQPAYNVQVGVLAYERTRGATGASSMSTSSMSATMGSN